ncbi:MAG: Holliday junction resolvase RuvX, partial [Gemmatimonadaceae bacterium]
MMPSERGRWMAVDWGERRIGLALSDPSGTIASPAGVVQRRGREVPERCGSRRRCPAHRGQV